MDAEIFGKDPKRKFERRSHMKKFLSTLLSAALALSLAAPALTPAASAHDFETTPYELQVEDSERAAVHAEVDKMVGYVGDMKVGDGTYDPYSLIGGLAEGSSYNSISYGTKAPTPTEYPFYVGNSETNFNEHDRKTAKLAWVVELCEALGFETIVQRQEDKYVYVEIGDPDAPEMVMALSHLDSPTASNAAGKNLDRWVNYEGELDPTAYYNPYVRDGWLYGAGVQDDSGPTLATLFAAAALKNSGVEFDRRIRIVMGCYEDGGPGTPSVANTLKYMDIPYYTSNPSFYDNWAYKSLNREETPIAGYTSDSRFPVVVGNSKDVPATLYMDLSEDEGKAFSLVNTQLGVTLRENDPTLKDIVYGSAAQVASRAIITLDTEGVEAEAKAAFIESIEEAAEAQGWLPTEEGVAKVAITDNDDTLDIEINTGITAEYPTPQYGKSAVTWAMYLLSEVYAANGIDLQLKVAADALNEMFFADGEEGEAYIGKYLGIPKDLLRNPDSGVANLTFAVEGDISDEDITKFNFFNTANNELQVFLKIRSMHTNVEDYTTAMDTAIETFTDAGFTYQSSGTKTVNGKKVAYEPGEYPAFSAPSLYLTHENPLTALQYESYKASMDSNPDEFADVYGLLDISYPVGTTGGTLATNFRNKMTAFGAVIPGNERWWHSANERISISSIVEMTKLMADGMLEMARYNGDAGAQLMWADIEGLNAERAELDLLDVTVGTFQDASDEISAEILAGDVLLGATKFDMPMWKDRGNTSYSQAVYDLGHENGGCYLPLDNDNFKENTFVAPMRLEFKVQRGDMSRAQWEALEEGGYADLSFNLLVDGEVVTLTLPEGADASKYFDVREDENDISTLYLGVNIAVIDGEYDGVKTILADSKTDLYKLNAEWEAKNGNPFPERGQITERGFFLFGDGEKNARFESPDAIYVTTAKVATGDAAAPSIRDEADVVAPEAPVAPEATFADVPATHWANAAVEAVAKAGLFNGTSETTFTPDAATTRGQLMTVLARLSGTKAATLEEGIAWAIANNVSDGSASAEKITREQLVTMLYRYAGSPAVTGDLSAYADAASVSDWAQAAMTWAVQQGIITGMTQTTLAPAGNATRAQVATIVQRYAGL